MLTLPGQPKDISIDGIRIRYVEAGDGSPVVLVHGLTSSKVAWRDNIAALAARHRVYAIDLPGHGDSDKPDIDYDADFMVELVRRFILALGHRQAALAGVSLGGGLALMTALEHPDVVSKLILCGSAALGREVATIIRLAALPRLGEFVIRGPVDKTRVTLRKCFFDKRLASRDLLEDLRRTNRLPGAQDATLKIVRRYIGAWGVRRRYIMSRRLKSLELPTLLFWGANDEIIPVAHAHRAARILPNCELHVFADCGHWAQIERADDFNRLSLEFLSR